MDGHQRIASQTLTVWWLVLWRPANAGLGMDETSKPID
jgi:hypothetical protein